MHGREQRVFLIIMFMWVSILNVALCTYLGAVAVSRDIGFVDLVLLVLYMGKRSSLPPSGT